MFGYTLISKEELKELRKAYDVRTKVVQCHRWFSGWKDLDIIWDYILSPMTFGGVDNARDRYAGARGTDVYGKEKQT